jgi:hypothetical protein
MKRSTLTLWLALGAPLLITACATIAPPLPPSLDLPSPPSDLRASRKGDHITLTWAVPSLTTDRQTIRSVGPTRICRAIGADLSECGVPVGEVPATSLHPTQSAQKGPATHTGTLPAEIESDNPLAFATYAVEVLNREGRGAGLSNQVRVSTVRTLLPPRNFQARVTSPGVVLTWAAENPLEKSGALHYVVRVYRRPEASEQQTIVGEAPLGGEPSLTDSGIEWGKTYLYHAETVTVVDDPNLPPLQVEGDDTPEMKVFADDVFPPAVPSNLQAVFSGPGQKPFIDLVWAPVSDVDLAGYNVYRHEERGAPVKLNSEPLKTPAYRDTSVASGKTYFYSVSAIDGPGNESARSEEASEVVP